MKNEFMDLINAFMQWYKGDPHHNNEDFYPNLKTPEYLESLNQNDFVEFFFQFVREGGKIQSGGHRTAGKFKEAIEQDFDNFRNFILEPYRIDFDLDNWLLQVAKYNSFGQGASTIFLNRIDKNRFVIVNNKSINALKALGYEVKGYFIQIYHSIETAQSDLITKYPNLQNFYMADALTHFLIGTEEGRVFLPDQLLTLIEEYKELKRKNGHSDEFYKYEAIQHFQKNWDIEAADFAAMVDNALKKQTNLLFYGSYGTIQKVATRFPEKTQQQFRNLFDESKDLTERMNVFERTIDSFMKQIDPKRSGMQDERAMAAYLTFRYPQKYYFYKDSFYTKFVKLLKDKKASKGSKYIHYLKLCDKFKEEYIFPDNELWELTNATLPANAWPDESRNVLTQDILYCVLDQILSINYWIFQCNPKEYDIVNEWKNRDNDTWRVTTYKSEIKNGDKVILWVVGKDSGCYGLCTITSDVLSDDNGSWVEMDIDYNLTESPVLKTVLDNTEAFNNRRNSQGTNFKATKDQYDTILKHLLPNNPIEPEKPIEMKVNNNLPKNLILYGPPGTGKTYNTINLAMEITAPEFYEKYKTEDSRGKLVEEFNQLRKNRQIEFVTFHQSFGYEEFVEGIKPIPIGDLGNENGEEMIYKVSDGIFKRICGDAEIGEIKGNYGSSQISPESRVFKVSLKGERNKATKQECFEKNEIRIGWEKTGSLEELFELQEDNVYYQNLGKNDKNSLKYFYNMEEGDIALICKNSKTIDAIGVITGNYIFDKTLSEYNHVRKVKWLLKEEDINIYELNGNLNLTLPTVYQLSRITPAMVTKLVQENSGEKKVVKESKNYVLIIDEINRGNISKIFGELITLIEPDKRQGDKNALEVTLPYSKTKFSVPSNLYIIGTMNTADRSIALIDTALRRRFEFMEMMPDYSLLSKNVEGVNLQKLLETINERITFLLDRDHTIGHAYFMNVKTKDDLCKTFRNQVIPLLQEYFYNDWWKIQLVLGDNDEWKKNPSERLVRLKKTYLIKEEKDLFGCDIEEFEDQKVYEINPSVIECRFSDFPKEGFVHIYEKP